MLINEGTALADLKWLVENMESHCSEDQLLSRQELAAILREATEQKTAGGWISVEDRLPEETGRMTGYLVAIGDWVGIMPYFNGTFWENPIRGVKPTFPVHHWMPLPEPPKEDKAHG